MGQCHAARDCGFVEDAIAPRVFKDDNAVGGFFEQLGRAGIDTRRIGDEEPAALIEAGELGCSTAAARRFFSTTNPRGTLRTGGASIGIFLLSPAREALRTASTIASRTASADFLR